MWVSTSPSRNSTALRLLCRLPGTEIKRRVLSAFHLAACSCFHYRSGSRIPLPAENLNVALAVRQYLIYSHKSPPLLVPDYFHPKMGREGGELCERLGPGLQPPLAIFVNLSDSHQH